MYKRHSVSKNKRKLLNALAMTRRVLLCFADSMAGATARDDAAWYINPFFDPQNRLTVEDRYYIKRAREKRAVYELKRRKFIETRELGGKVMYRLTEKGRMAALKDAIRASDNCRDGSVILVSFDIPEQEKYVRAKLRYHLKDFGFDYMQDSVWATKRDIGPLLVKLVKDIGATKWVRLFSSKEMLP